MEDKSYLDNLVTALIWSFCAFAFVVGVWSMGMLVYRAFGP